MVPHVHMDLDDRIIHYLLIGVGLTVGSLIKVGFDKLAEHFWDAEWKEFRKWKATIEVKKD
jgi:hypothetical protein